MPFPALHAIITTLYMLATGDFPAWAPWQEDSQIVDDILTIATALIWS